MQTCNAQHTIYAKKDVAIKISHACPQTSCLESEAFLSQSGRHSAASALCIVHAPASPPESMIKRVLKSIKKLVSNQGKLILHQFWSLPYAEAKLDLID